MVSEVGAGALVQSHRGRGVTECLLLVTPVRWETEACFSGSARFVGLTVWLPCFVRQGMLVTETIMDHIAKSVGMDPHVLRTQNLYKVKRNLVDDRTVLTTAPNNASVVYRRLLPCPILSRGILSCRSVVPCRTMSYRWYRAVPYDDGVKSCAPEYLASYIFLPFRDVLCRVLSHCTRRQPTMMSHCVVSWLVLSLSGAARRADTLRAASGGLECARRLVRHAALGRD